MADKVRVKGNRVIHSAKNVYKGAPIEAPRGLTAEQAEEQRTGSKLAARQSREAAQRAVEASPRKTKGGSDELAAVKGKRK